MEKGSNHLELLGFADSLGTALSVQLFQDMADVGFSCIKTDNQFISDLEVRKAFCQKPQDFQFALTQRIGSWI